MNSPFCQVAQIKNYLLDPFLSTDIVPGHGDIPSNCWMSGYLRVHIEIFSNNLRSDVLLARSALRRPKPASVRLDRPLPRSRKLLVEACLRETHRVFATGIAIWRFHAPQMLLPRL